MIAVEKNHNDKNGRWVPGREKLDLRIVCESDRSLQAQRGAFSAMQKSRKM